MIEGIHAVFPPPHIIGHSGANPISKKKLLEGEETWSFTKEILGWELNRLHATITLPASKCEKICKLLKQSSKESHLSLKQFQRIAGKLQHASYAIPGGPGLFSQFDQVMKGASDRTVLTSTLRKGFVDWKLLIQHLAKHPTHVKQLCKNEPHYIGYSDACKLGASGVLCSGQKSLFLVVWQLQWPPDIIKKVKSAQNSTGTLSINNLELAGMVLNWLVLEDLGVSLHHAHIALYCDNTSAVSWSYKH